VTRREKCMLNSEKSSYERMDGYGLKKVWDSREASDSAWKERRRITSNGVDR
jgi:hypothetical protein